MLCPLTLEEDSKQTSSWPHREIIYLASAPTTVACQSSLTLSSHFGSSWMPVLLSSETCNIFQLTCPYPLGVYVVSSVSTYETNFDRVSILFLKVATTVMNNILLTQVFSPYTKAKLIGQWPKNYKTGIYLVKTGNKTFVQLNNKRHMGSTFHLFMKYLEQLYKQLYVYTQCHQNRLVAALNFYGVQKILFHQTCEEVTSQCPFSFIMRSHPTIILPLTRQILHAKIFKNCQEQQTLLNMFIIIEWERSEKPEATKENTNTFDCITF